MPLDPRIAMGGVQQAYDGLGAFRTARADQQRFQQNQMTMQAAEAAAQRNAMARQRASTVDPTDRTSVNAFVSEFGPDAQPYIEAWGSGDTMFTNRAAEDRAQGKFNVEQRDSNSDFMQRMLGAVYNDPSDTNIAAVRAQAIAAGIDEAAFDAYAARFIAAPPEQRRDLLANELGTTKEGQALLKTFAPEYDIHNAGGSLQPVQTNPLAPGFAPPAPITVTPSPNRPVILQTAEGMYSATPGGGPAAPVVGPDGQTLQPYVAPPRTAPGQTQQDTAARQQRATEIMRSGATAMRSALTTLRDENFLRSSRDNQLSGAGQFIRDAIPGGRGLALSMNPTADAAQQVINGTKSTMVGQLKDMYGASSRAMDAVKELELALAQFGAEGGNYDAGITLLDDLENRLDLIDRIFQQDMGGGSSAGGGDSRAALEAEARRRGLIQ
jgi:hypothetical protein